jgi:hypothetical protein
MKSKIVTQALTLLFIVLLSCNKSVPETKEDIDKFKLELKKENLRTMFLGALNFCSETDYETYFNNSREMGPSPLKGGDCCTSLVKYPYINLAEYYIYSMEGDRSIFDNRDNPFKLKEIRKTWERKVKEARKEAEKVDPKNLVFKGFRNVYVDTYDLDAEKLKFGIGNMVMISFNGVQGDWHGMIDFRYKGGKPPVVTELNLSPEEGEKLFKYYENNKKNANLPPSKNLNTIITYSLEKPKNNGYLSRILVNIKKVEYYYPDGWDKKIGEVTF